MAHDAAPLPQDALLGAILVRTAGLPLDTLDQALASQAQSGAKLGAILREMNAITAGQLLRALEVQSQLRRGAPPGPPAEPSGEAGPG